MVTGNETEPGTAIAAGAGVGPGRSRRRHVKHVGVLAARTEVAIDRNSTVSPVASAKSDTAIRGI